MPLHYDESPRKENGEHMQEDFDYGTLWRFFSSGLTKAIRLHYRGHCKCANCEKVRDDFAEFLENRRRGKREEVFFMSVRSQETELQKARRELICSMMEVPDSSLWKEQLSALQELDAYARSTDFGDSREHLGKALEHLQVVIFSMIRFHIEDSRALKRIISDLRAKPEKEGGDKSEKQR